MVYVVVESLRVRSRGNKHHHKRAFLGLVVRFLDPFRKLPSIRRIAKYPFAPPILREAILRLGEVLRTLRILVRAASSSSNKACGVAHSTDALENKQLFFCNESLHHI